MPAATHVASGISSPSGQIILRPATEGREIILGSASDAAFAVELSDGELDRVFASALVIGSTDTGRIREIEPISPGGTANLTLLSAT